MDKQHMPAPDHLARRLTDRGLRLTRLRRRLLAVLLDSEEHLTVNQIFERLCRENIRTNISSVYRNMEVLASVGVVHAHNFLGGKSCYEVRGSDHDHLIDLGTGRVLELRSATLDRLKQEVARAHGYRAEACRVEIYAD